jgi:hypothetical protein
VVKTTCTTSYHHNKAVAVAPHDGHSESEEVSNNPTKAYPMKGNYGISHEDVAEITSTPTVLMTSDSEYILTSSKQGVVVEELV